MMPPMSACPVEGCERPIARGYVLVAQHAADLDVFFPMLDRLNLHMPYEDRPWILDFTSKGLCYRWEIHEAAHLNATSDVPSVEELDQWRNAAHELTMQLVRWDLDWYRAYWRKYFESHPDDRRFAS